eukprot:g937.t1
MTPMRLQVPSRQSQSRSMAIDVTYDQARLEHPLEKLLDPRRSRQQLQPEQYSSHGVRAPYLAKRPVTSLPGTFSSPLRGGLSMQRLWTTGGAHAATIGQTMAMSKSDDMNGFSPEPKSMRLASGTPTRLWTGHRISVPAHINHPSEIFTPRDDFVVHDTIAETFDDGDHVWISVDTSGGLYVARSEDFAVSAFMHKRFFYKQSDGLQQSASMANFGTASAATVDGTQHEKSLSVQAHERQAHGKQAHDQHQSSSRTATAVAKKNKVRFRQRADVPLVPSTRRALEKLWKDYNVQGVFDLGDAMWASVGECLYTNFSALAIVFRHFLFLKSTERLSLSLEDFTSFCVSCAQTDGNDLADHDLHEIYMMAAHVGEDEPFIDGNNPQSVALRQHGINFAKFIIAILQLCMRKYTKGSSLDAKLNRFLSVCIIPASIQIAKLWKYPATDDNITKLLREQADRLFVVYTLYLGKTTHGSTNVSVSNDLHHEDGMSINEWIRLLSDAAVVDGAMNKREAHSCFVSAMSLLHFAQSNHFETPRATFSEFLEAIVHVSERIWHTPMENLPSNLQQLLRVLLKVSELECNVEEVQKIRLQLGIVPGNVAAGNETANSAAKGVQEASSVATIKTKKKAKKARKTKKKSK